MLTWTSLKLIRWTAGYFEKKGIPNPRLDAELLLAAVLQCPRIDLYTAHDKKIHEKELIRFRRFVERRARREPLQYLLGETDFYGLKIKVTPAVLIPRPETEGLVEEGLKQLTAHGSRFTATESVAVSGQLSAVSILEIGTGSGCIAIALAKNIPHARIVATEISPEALEVARENAEVHQVADRIEFVLADIASAIPGGGDADPPPGPPAMIRSRGVNPTLAHGTFDRRFRAAGTLFDLIVSNPPYIPTGAFPHLQPEVRDFEPRQALDGGPDGLAIIRKILEESFPFLKPAAPLLLEIGEDQAAPLREIAKGSLRWHGTRKDLSGHERVAIWEKIT